MKKINCVLLIDDDPTANYINHSIVQGLNISEETKVFTNAEEALNYIENNCEGACPELILLDIKMPVFDGFEFLEAFDKLVFKNKENVKVVMLSSSLLPREIEKFKDFGALDFVQKPLTSSKMVDLLDLHFN